MKLTKKQLDDRFEAGLSGDIHVPASMNRATAALFWEKRHDVRWKERGITPIFNMSMKDHNGTLSFGQLYLQCSSDYQAALVILGKWEHWERLLNTKWFPPYLQKLKEQKVLYDEALACAKLQEQAHKGNVTALRYLLSRDKSNNPAPKPKASPKTEKQSKPRDGKPLHTDNVEEGLDDWLSHAEGADGE